MTTVHRLGPYPGNGKEKVLSVKLNSLDGVVVGRWQGLIQGLNVFRYSNSLQHLIYIFIRLDEVGLVHPFGCVRQLKNFI